MEDWLKCQISPLVKYRQNQTKLFKFEHFTSKLEPLSYNYHGYYCTSS